MKRFLIVSSWFATTITALVVSLWSWVLLTGTEQGPALVSQEAQILGVTDERVSHLATYAAIPDAVGELRTAIKSKDARPLVIENYLKQYRSPLVGYGEYIVVKAAELGIEYEIDPTYLAYLTIAIAQNESNLGKKMPPNCHNAWGYGIHSAGTLCFASWEEGITEFMTGLARDFIDQAGLETPQEIMTRYTPHSPNGAWARSVNGFLDDLYEGRL